MSPATVETITYSKEGAEAPRELTIEDAANLRAPGRVVWMNVISPSEETLAELGRAFDLHPLAIEDTHHIPQRAKVEDYTSHLFLVAHMPRGFMSEEAPLPRGRFLEQLSIFMGPGYVLTIQEIAGDAFNGVRERIANGRGRIRRMGADYLVYALFDAVVDAYFPVIEHLGERLSELEDDATQDPRQETLAAVRRVKRELLTLRRVAWPQRDAAAWFERAEHPLLHSNSRPFFRDVNDHATRILDAIEVQRELASDVDNLYMNTLNTRTNEIMKVLTIVATIFIPLSFIAGVYGMNFDPSASGYNMPELGWVYGYPFALALMVTTAGGLLVYMFRSGWLR